MSDVDLALQSVAFGTDRPALLRTAAAAAEAAAALRRECPTIGAIEWRLADCTVPAVLDAALLDELRAAIDRAAPDASLALRPMLLNANRGPSAAHNLLWQEFGRAGLLFLMAPDLVLQEHALRLLVAELDDPGVGAVAARRLPIEVAPLGLTPDGEARRAGGARTLLRGAAWHEVGGHEEAYFLDGNDHDLSARLLAAGWRLRYQPAAVVFHDNRPDARGLEPPGPTRRYYAALGRLILLHTWSADRALSIVRRRLAIARDPHRRRALDDFERRERTGQLPARRSHPAVTPDLEATELADAPAAPTRAERPIAPSAPSRIGTTADGATTDAVILPAERLQVRVIGDDAVARRDTLLSIRAQTSTATITDDPRPSGGEGWVVELRAGDLLIADAIDRLRRALVACDADAIELPALAQTHRPMLIGGVPGRMRIDPAAPLDPSDRRVIVRRAGVEAVAVERLASLGDRPLVVVSREAG